ncbi:MAG: tyrosine-type recombinase/integrase [Alistipes finegoldii]
MIRHTTATHLLQAGVDINTIRAWLGHVSVDTTNVYAEVSMKAKSEALDCCEVISSTKQKCWKDNPDIMAFLNGLYK